jgi:hypothetical protein
MHSHWTLMGTLGNDRYRLFWMVRSVLPHPLFHRAKYSTSSPPALLLSRRRSAANKILPRRLSMRRDLRTLESSLCHRCPAHRLVPSGRPRALGHARCRASPGIRVSRSGSRRQFKSLLRATKNPPERLAREGPCWADCQISPRQDRSHEPGMRCRSASRRSTGLLVFRVRKSLSDPCGFTNPVVREGAGHTPGS